MDELAKIQNSLEDMKETQEANSDLYDNVHYYPTKTITKIPSNLKSTDEEDGHNLKDSGIKIIKQGKENKINFTYFENDIQHQKGGTECGIYSLHFIINMIEGNDFQDYISEHKSDKFIEKFRNIYFIDN